MTDESRQIAAARYPGFCRCELRPGDGAYPELLAQISDPPAVLYVIGSTEVLAPGLAVVGARRATPYGLACAEVFAERAAASGVTVISGGAIGCDQAAARGALAAKGRTVAVMGCGADVVYPKRACGLYARILSQGGALVSEQPWGTGVRRGMFVRRNRIIAGLARATLIIEAGLPSGTFSTADAALASGRDVLVVPGSIHSPESRGSNRLLFQGAQPVVDMDSFDAYLTALFGVLPMRYSDSGKGRESSGLSPEKAKLVSMLAANPMRLSDIAEAAGVDASRIARLVAECESFGIVERYHDGRFGVPVIQRRIPAPPKGW